MATATTTAADMWLEDIKLVFDNHPYSELWIQTIVDRGYSIRELGVELWNYYHDCLSFVLNETPSNSVGHMLIRQMLNGIPLIVFERLAQTYLDPNN
jgi:hypothetical protein